MAINIKERKESYKKILGLMLDGKNKQAFDELRLMAGTDAGLFLLKEYPYRNFKQEANHDQ